MDMGAGSIRNITGTIKDKRIIFEEIIRIENEIQSINSRHYWDLDNIYIQIKKGLTKALQSMGDDICTLGIDSWGTDYVLLDSEGNLVEKPISYRDNRTIGMRELWRTHMDDRETFHRTGVNYVISNTLYQLLSMKNSQALNRTDTILFIPGYISYLLTRNAVNELSIASTSQMLELGSAEWDRKILQALELPADKIAKIIKAGEKIGRVTIPETGKNRIECIGVCGHDTACAAVAMPTGNKNHAFLIAGTWCVLGVQRDGPLLDDGAMNLGFSNEKGYNNNCLTVKNMTGFWLLQQLKKHFNLTLDYNEIEEMVEQEEKGGHVIDPDDPVFFNPDNMITAFNDYFKRTGQPRPERISEYLRCVYDSLCLSFRYYLDHLENLLAQPIDTINLMGGGSNSPFLSRKIASVCNRNVVSGPAESAAIGNIIIQGITMGTITDLEESRRLICNSCEIKEYKPGPVERGYDVRYRKLLELLGHADKE